MRERLNLAASAFLAMVPFWLLGMILVERVTAHTYFGLAIFFSAVSIHLKLSAMEKKNE